MTVEITGPEWADVLWTSAHSSSKTVIGGKLSDSFNQAAYPHFDGKPLPYFAQLALDNEQIAYIFLNDHIDGSWAAENAANAVIIASKAPDWVTVAPLAHTAPKRLRKAYTHSEPIPTEPDWLQGDETPENFNFVLQVPSNIDPKLNIGDGYGTVYIFINDDQTTGRIVWQS